MHPQHTQKMRVICWQRSQPHQRQGCWPAGYLYQLAQAFCRFRAAIDDAAAAINHWPFGCFHHLYGLFYCCLVRREYRTIAMRFICPYTAFLIGRIQHLNIFWQVNDHRAWPAGTRHMKGFFNRALQISALLDQVIMFGTGTGNAGCIAFLKGICADQMAGYLAGQTHNRHRIHQRVCQTGYRIGCPRP